MPGFPISWTDVGLQGQTWSETCPYPAAEIRAYLNLCHYHFGLDEPVGEFGFPVVVAEEVRERCRIWHFHVLDPLGRPWRVIVGTGTSCFNPNDGSELWRWMWAEGQDPDECLEKRVERTWQELRRVAKPTTALCQTD